MSRAYLVMSLWHESPPVSFWRIWSRPNAILVQSIAKLGQLRGLVLRQDGPASQKSGWVHCQHMPWEALCPVLIIIRSFGGAWGALLWHRGKGVVQGASPAKLGQLRGLVLRQDGPASQKSGWVHCRHMRWEALCPVLIIIGSFNEAWGALLWHRGKGLVQGASPAKLGQLRGLVLRQDGPASQKSGWVHCQHMRWEALCPVLIVIGSFGGAWWALLWHRGKGVVQGASLAKLGQLWALVPRQDGPTSQRSGWVHC